jgi:hypothetical protein
MTNIEKKFNKIDLEGYKKHDIGQSGMGMPGQGNFINYLKQGFQGSVPR